MPTDPEEALKREATARAHIAAVYGTPGDEFDVTLFVSHHLSELDASYWMKYTGTPEPDARQVLGILVLLTDPEEEDLPPEEEPLDTMDFSLPGGVTNYLICVEFDDAGKVIRVAMES